LQKRAKEIKTVVVNEADNKWEKVKDNIADHLYDNRVFNILVYQVLGFVVIVAGFIFFAVGTLATTRDLLFFCVTSVLPTTYGSFPYLSDFKRKTRNEKLRTQINEDDVQCRFYCS
jgi:hypothetical protein